MKIHYVAVCITLAAVLSACNSTDSTLGVEGSETQAATVTPSATPSPSLSTSTPAAQQAVTLNTVRMRFAPIIGAPVDKVTPLSRRITARAKEKSIAIVASTDQTATHVFKGYFSVLAEGPSSTVIYVFDVLDTAGNRLHRIQGQESTTGSNSTDSWAAIPATLMETIADKAMAEFTKWLGAPNA